MPRCVQCHRPHGITTGQRFPDALAGGVLQAKVGSVMLLTSSAVLSPATQTLLQNNKAAISNVTFFGGTGVVSDAIRTAALTIRTVLCLPRSSGKWGSWRAVSTPPS